MWENTIGSVRALKGESFKGSGCILAHCMGLGKVSCHLTSRDSFLIRLTQTFSVIAFTLSLCTSPALREIKSPSTDRPRIFTILIVAPKNTISNWKDEYSRWMPPEYKDQVRVRLMDSTVGLNKKKQGILLSLNESP